MSSRLTMIAGTPTFVAPEQAQGERLDARADQYSLAALTYLLFTGRAPYAHASLAAAAAPGEPPVLSAPGREFPERGRAGRRPGALARPGSSAGPTSRRTSWRCARRSATASARRCRRRGCRWTPSSPSPARARRQLPDSRAARRPDATDRRRRPSGGRCLCRHRRAGHGRRGRVCGVRRQRRRRDRLRRPGSLSVTVPADWRRVVRQRRVAAAQRQGAVRRPLGRHRRGLDVGRLRGRGRLRRDHARHRAPDPGAAAPRVPAGRSLPSPTWASWGRR